MNLINFLIALTVAPFKIAAVSRKRLQQLLPELRDVSRECVNILIQKEEEPKVGVSEAERTAENKEMFKKTYPCVYVKSIEGMGTLIESVGGWRLVRLESEEHGWYEAEDVVAVS